MIHVRTRLTADFTVTANALAQRRGSAVTVGVAVYIAPLPDGSPVSITALCEHVSEGEILVSRALRELETAGYLERRRERTPSGQARTRTYFYDVPGGAPHPDGPPEPPRPRSSRPTAEVVHGAARETVQPPVPAEPGTPAPLAVTDAGPARRHRRRSPSRRRTRRPAPGRPPPHPVRAGGRPPRPGRQPVARGRSAVHTHHGPPHRPAPLADPPGRDPRPPAQGDAPAATGQERGTPRTSGSRPPGELRRLRPGNAHDATHPLSGLPHHGRTPHGGLSQGETADTFTDGRASRLLLKDPGGGPV